MGRKADSMSNVIQSLTLGGQGTLAVAKALHRIADALERQNSLVKRAQHPGAR